MIKKLLLVTVIAISMTVLACDDNTENGEPSDAGEDTETDLTVLCDPYCVKLIECIDMITWDMETCMANCKDLIDDPAWTCAVQCDHSIPCEDWDVDCFQACSN